MYDRCIWKRILFSSIPFGYTKDKLAADPKKIIIDENDAPYVRRIFELYLQGNLARQVMEIMNKETGEECTYEVPAIIDKQTWSRMQEQYRKNQLTCKRKQTYIFMPKIKCPLCGHDVLWGTNGKGKSGQKFCYYNRTRCKSVGYIPEVKTEEAFVKGHNQTLTLKTLS